MNERPFTQECIHPVRSEGMDKSNVVQCKEARIQSNDERIHILLYIRYISQITRSLLWPKLIEAGDKKTVSQREETQRRQNVKFLALIDAIVKEGGYFSALFETNHSLSSCRREALHAFTAPTR